MTPLQSVKQKIIKAVPEIKKREIEYKNSKFLDKNGREIKDFATPIYSVVGEACYNITLEDVLMALSKKAGEWSITAWGNNVCMIDKDIKWQLQKPLHLQKQETINFLDKIL